MTTTNTDASNTTTEQREKRATIDTLPNVNDSDSAERLSEQSAFEVKTTGGISAATALEMIARIRQLEHGLLIGDDLHYAIQTIENFRQHLPLTYETVLGYFAIRDRGNTILGYVYTASFADWLCASWADPNCGSCGGSGYTSLGGCYVCQKRAASLGVEAQKDEALFSHCCGSAIKTEIEPAREYNICTECGESCASRTLAELIEIHHQTPAAAPTSAQERQKCPFKVGDRVRFKAEVRGGWPEATVTKITERGFKYEYDELHVLGTRIGSSHGGEAYASSFDLWELVPAASAQAGPDAIGDGHFEALKAVMNQRAIELHKAPGAFVSQMAVVAAQYVREQLATAAVPTKPIVEQCLSELREMFGKDEEETEEK